MKVKKAIALILAMMMMVSLATAGYAADDTVIDTFEIESVRAGRDVILKNVAVIPNLGYVVSNPVSLDMTLGQTDIAPMGLPEKETSKTYAHNISDSNGVLLVTVNVTVTGVYSQVDNWSEIIGLSVAHKGNYTQYFTYSTSMSGNTGSVYAYFNGLHCGTFSYKIASNGYISEA